MYIYAAQITPRLEYIVQQLFPAARFISSAEEFHRAEGPKINYSTHRFSDHEFHIRPAGLLTEQGIRTQHLRISQWEGMKVFFPTNGDIPFDFFSAAFYLLSRYEEYLPHQKDSYGRFAHTGSLAWKEGFLQQPLVNNWLVGISRLLEAKFGSALPAPGFRFVPSYDIDIAYASKGRGRLHQIAALLRGEKTKINGKDAFDIYDWLDELHQRYQLSPIYFFLVAERRSRYDKNLSPRSAALQQLVHRVASEYETGVHPSWQSFDDEEMLKNEMGRLAAMTGRPVQNSRQHYIRFTLPHSFRCLVAAGITGDYSMGYGSINGFRASYALPYHWYDLMKEAITPLVLHPFCYMEANSCFEQQLDAEQAAAELKEYYQKVKEVGGTLITVFHNHFLTEDPAWQPWRDMYSGFLQWQHGQAAITSPSQREP